MALLPRPQQEPLAAAIAAADIILITQASAVVQVTGTTISAQASDNSYNDSANGFLAAGIAPGMGLKVSGFTGSAGNNTDVAIALSVTAGKIIVSGVTLVDDAAGESVTVAQLITRRTSAAAIRTIDASTVTLSVADASDWNGGVDPGDTDDALNQLADRTKSLEAAIGAAVNIPSQRFTMETGSTADSDPTAGLLKFNNSTHSSATFAYVDDLTSDGVDLSTFFNALGATGFMKVQSAADAGEWIIFRWTAVTDATGYFKFALTYQAHLGTLDDGDALLVEWDSDAAGGSSSAGRHEIWIPASAMLPSATGGCDEVGRVASGANQPDIVYLGFDASVQEYAQFSRGMEKSWDEGTVSFIPYWSHASTSTNFGVVWELQAVAIGNNEAIGTAFGTMQSSTDTGGTTDREYIGPESSAITVAGSPAAGDHVRFRISRHGGNLAVDGRLHGILLVITTDAGTDA